MYWEGGLARLPHKWGWDVFTALPLDFWNVSALLHSQISLEESTIGLQTFVSLCSHTGWVPGVKTSGLDLPFLWVDPDHVTA